MYVFSLEKTFDVCKSKRFQITSDMHRFATIEAVVFCLVTLTVHSEIIFSDHLFCVIFVFFVVRFAVLSHRKNITVKTRKRFSAAVFQSFFNLSHVKNANMYIYLHRLCSKSKHTFYTSKDRLHNNNFLA